MTITMKRALYMSAIGLFFAVAPLMLLYATGYRVTPGTLSYERVGAFFIKSFPADAEIIADGHITGKKTPGRLLNMGEGTHSLEVALEGYVSWHKKLPITESGTTFIETIQLLKKNPRETILSSGGRQTIISPNGAAYAFINSANEIVITNTEKSASVAITASITPHTLLAVSPANDRLIFGSGATAWLLDINTERIKPIQFPRRSITKAQWDPQNSSLLWLQSSGDLFSYDLTSDTYQLRKSNIDAFLINNAGLALLSHERAEHYNFELHNALTLDVVWSQMFTARAKPLVADADATFAIIQDPTNTYLLQPGTSSTYRGAFYGIKKDAMLLYDGLEVIAYDLSTQKSWLVTRTTQSILSLEWHTSGDYILLNEAGKILVLELDRRDQQQQTTIASVDENASLILSPDGSRLFIVTPTANRVLEIQ